MSNYHGLKDSRYPHRSCSSIVVRSRYNIGLPMVRTATTTADLKVGTNEVAKPFIDQQRPRTKPGELSGSTVLLPGVAGKEIPLVLIVADNPQTRYELANSLGHHFKIRLVDDRKEGLMLARELSPDLVISGVLLPEKNGFEQCQRNIDRQSSTNVINHSPTFVQKERLSTAGSKCLHGN